MLKKSITLGRKDSLHARRLLLSRYPNEGVVDLITSVLQKPASPHDRVVTLVSFRVGARAGDQADMAFLEIVDYVAPRQLVKRQLKVTKKHVRRSVRLGRQGGLRRRVRRIQSKSRSGSSRLIA